jgi:hypothetical protein
LVAGGVLVLSAGLQPTSATLTNANNAITESSFFIAMAKSGNFGQRTSIIYLLFHPMTDRGSVTRSDMSAPDALKIS